MQELIEDLENLHSDSIPPNHRIQLKFKQETATADIPDIWAVELPDIRNIGKQSFHSILPVANKESEVVAWQQEIEAFHFYDE